MMMKCWERCIFYLPIFLLLFVAHLSFISESATAQEVAVLVSADLAPYQQAVRGFVRQMPPHISVSTYQMKADVLSGREMGQQIRASAADLTFAVGLKAALVAKLEIVDTPVVFGVVLNPQDYDLPADNMIGIQLRVSIDEQLSMMRSLHPSVMTIGMLYDPEQSARFVSDVRSRARSMGLKVLSYKISEAAAVPDALRAVLPAIDMLWLFRDSTVVTHASIPFLLESALESSIPVFGYSSGLSQHGATAALSVDYHEVGRQAADVSMAIIGNGTMPSSSPRLLAPQNPQLTLNLGTARYLGLTLSPKLVQVAQTVFGGSSEVAQQQTADGDPVVIDPSHDSVVLP